MNEKKQQADEEENSSKKIQLQVGLDKIYYKKYLDIKEKKGMRDGEFLRHIVEEYLNFHYPRETNGELYFPTELIEILYRHFPEEEIPMYVDSIANLTVSKFRLKDQDVKTLCKFLTQYFRHSSSENQIKYYEDKNEIRFRSTMNTVWTSITLCAIGKTLEKFGYEVNLHNFIVKDKFIKTTGKWNEGYLSFKLKEKKK